MLTPFALAGARPTGRGFFISRIAPAAGRVSLRYCLVYIYRNTAIFKILTPRRMIFFPCCGDINSICITALWCTVLAIASSTVIIAGIVSFVIAVVISVLIA